MLIPSFGPICLHDFWLQEVNCHFERKFLRAAQHAHQDGVRLRAMDFKPPFNLSVSCCRVTGTFTIMVRTECCKEVRTGHSSMNLLHDVGNRLHDDQIEPVWFQNFLEVPHHLEQRIVPKPQAAEYTNLFLPHCSNIGFSFCFASFLWSFCHAMVTTPFPLQGRKPLQMQAAALAAPNHLGGPALESLWSLW
jgi:hypothetical protein